MTLNEGLKSLMSSDAANNGLIHETWTDKFIQVSYETHSEGNISGIIDKGKPRIKVISTFGDGDYAEDKFERKNLKDIKDYGWLIVGPEYLGKMYTKVLSKKREADIKSAKATTYQEPETFSVYDRYGKPAVIIEPDYLMYSGKSRPRGDDIWKAMCLFYKTTDFSNMEDLKILAEYVLQDSDDFDDVIYDDDCITVVFTTAKNTDVSLHPKNIILSAFKQAYNKKGCDDNLYKAYKRLMGFGLNSQDIKDFENIIKENNLSIPLDYLKDLDSFERNAAVEMVNKLIKSYLKHKR